MRPARTIAVAAALAMLAGGRISGADEWEAILQQALLSERSQTRHEGLKQVDTTKAKGLRAIWAALSVPDPDRMDWFVREGAYEALLKAQGDEAEKEIDRVLKGSGNDLAKEAIVYAVVWKIRKEVEKLYGKNDDRKIEEVKFFLRKKRGVEYFEYVLPAIKTLDPEKKLLGRIQKALDDKSPRVRRAAITGLLTYPDNSNIPLLLGNLKKLEKQKARLYREWVLTRYALEILTGQYYRDVVADWFRWWDTVKDRFSIEKRIEDERGKEGADRGRTVVVRREGVEVTVHMKIAGPPDGYPLLVLPWRGFEADYFRPYFHGVEEFCRVFYVRMPQIEDYKGLARHDESNLVNYPTAVLAKGLADLMKDSGLDKFGLLAHGPDAGVLGMMMAADHPEMVTHLALINPRSSGRAYGEAIANVRREGVRRNNSEIVKGADSIQLGPGGKEPLYKPSDPGEAGGLGRALGDLHHADPTEPETGAMGYLYDLPGGTQVLNDAAWSAKEILGSRRSDLAVLAFMGEKSPWTPAGDMQAVAGLFQSPVVVRLPDAGEFPFISHTWLFTRQLETFFKAANAALKKSPSKKAEPKKKTEPKKSDAKKGKTAVQKKETEDPE